MSLATGSRLGAYEITGVLGAGGMGEVYRARDTVLNREVAIKVLPDALAQDHERIARFRREAELLAALNDPHIAQVYGVEMTNGLPAIVMELVDGHTLEQALTRGRLPWQEALVIARQIAVALDAAHERGIVHRDLKPANVKITEDGVLKVLDFGLAKAVMPAPAVDVSDAARSPTMTAGATQHGLILGTASYMAPEQAKGRSVDKRADIWAFGAVLFEMLAGRRAFEGDDVTEVLAAVLKTEPNWDALPDDVPHALRRVLSRCLEKDPRRRLRDIAEGMLQLDDGLAASSTPASRRQPWWYWFAPLATATLLIVGALFVDALLDARRAKAPRPPTRFEIMPADLTIARNPRPQIAIAPDGTIIYRARRGLLAKRPTNFTAEIIDGGAGTTPFVSPDGRWVGFLLGAALDNQLVKVPIAGGPRTPIAVSTERIWGADWGTNDTIVFGTAAGLFKVVPGSDQPISVTTGDKTLRGSHAWPAFAGSSDLVLFTLGQHEDAKLAAVNLVTGTITHLGVTGTFPRYLSTGHVAYVTWDGVLRAVPFDVRGVAVTGPSVPLESGVHMRASFGAADLDISDDGTLVYFSADAAKLVPVWVDRQGVESAIPVDAGAYTYPRLSTRGDQLVLGHRDRTQNVLIWQAARPGVRPLIRNIGQAMEAVWTTDDAAVLLPFDRNGRSTIVQMNADGSGQPSVMLEADQLVVPHARGPDGSVIVRHNEDIALLKLNATPRLETLIVDARNPGLSPDGRWLAFESTQSGMQEVYVRPFPKVDAGEWPISRGSGSMPVWSRDGDEIFYRSEDGMMSVPINVTGSGILADAPRRLFDASAYPPTGLGRHFDVGPGDRFLMLKRMESSPPVARVVLNFHHEVARQVATK